MCEPTALIATGLAISAASAGIGAYGSYQQAQASNKAAEYNAQVYDQKTKTAQAQGEVDYKKKVLEYKGLQGTQKAAYASGGVVVNEDSPLEVSKQTASYGQLDAVTAKQNKLLEAWGYSTQAGALRLSKINPVAAGGTSIMSSASGLGSTLFNWGTRNS